MIPQANPLASYKSYEYEIDDAIFHTLGSGSYILGENVTKFEQEFGRYIDNSYCAGVACGTDALTLALMACGIGPGDKVATVSHTALATVAAIVTVGVIPVLVDVEPKTYTINTVLLAQTMKRERNIKAIIPVHLYGHPADMTTIMALAKAYNAVVVEDCAQAHGATAYNKKVGSIGHIAAFSFYPTKNLGAIGDGGAVVSNNPELINKVKSLREYGWDRQRLSQYPGRCSRLDELQAAILRVKLRHLNAENERRRAIAEMYFEQLGGNGIKLPQVRAGYYHVFHQYVIRHSERDRLIRHLKINGIGAGIHYPVPCHLQPGYRDLVLIGAGGLPVTEKICNEIVSLPMYPQLADEEVGRICEVIRLL